MGRLSPSMFLFPPRRRLPRQILMHVYDAGEADGAAHIFIFKCVRCGHLTDWTAMETNSSARRGLPCPNCNKAMPA
jgi:hypothetical protein